MSKERKCYNCLHYTQAESFRRMGICKHGLNPALINAPPVALYVPQREYAADEMAGFCDKYVWAPLGYNRLRIQARTKIAQHGEKFSTANLCEKFVFWYEKGHDTKLKVQTSAGKWGTDFGHVALSTGYMPTFLLMPNIKARSSSVLLSDAHEIVGVRDAGKKGSKYRSVPTDHPWHYYNPPNWAPTA